jgi:hypothetical protein
MYAAVIPASLFQAGTVTFAVSKDAAIQALRKQLGDAPPLGLSTLSDEQLRDLAAAIEDARHRQAAALEEAGERALARIPRLLRRPVRKVVGA